MGITDGLKRGIIEILLLALLEEEDMYGYQICQELKKKSQGLFVISEGSLYPTLYRLLDKGYISDRTELVGRRRTRVYYHLNGSGKRYMKDALAQYYSITRGALFILKKGDLEEIWKYEGE